MLRMYVEDHARVKGNLTPPRRRDSCSFGQHTNVYVAQLPKLMQTGMIR